MARLLAGLLLSLAVAIFALRRGSLSPSGALAAVAVGTLIYVGGGPAWFAALMTFFATSTLLGRVGRAAKAATKREFEKGDTRDAMQVLANGGAAAAAALLMFVAPGPEAAALFLGALATANGDTWATELGVLSRGEPRSLLGFHRVPRGTSGAVSGLGLAASLAGATTIGLVAALAPGAFAGRALPLLFATAAGGTVGSLADSLLGATLQARHRCDACDRDTEGPRHHCGRATRRTGGIAGFDNDVVNLCATLAGALATLALL